ncbi:uncharacterized protein LOC120275701 [Dioscorea cayenensis subsp. rotundata]|uniref:Uncharacterized protein LOC120275701 n=1 Tax=Dioscorea cayennensis subsp. rotundata TaxID=55577 RepID=A0AB40CI46_DIOCR|nr:uncharacterized protein LOC120275701 [Dioscorea cayenensis subsp. rotundata]
MLNPTQDSNCWPKSPQGPMIPPESANRNRGRKPLMRKKDSLDEQEGYKRGKVSRKGHNNRCSVCGTIGHNKRFHGSQRQRTTGEQQNEEDARQHMDPMDTIDPEVLHEHFIHTVEMRDLPTHTNIAVNSAPSVATNDIHAEQEIPNPAHDIHIPTVSGNHANEPLPQES